MKVLGYLLIMVGIALLLYVGFYFMKDKNQEMSPLPDQKGVKVIIVTPTK